jgi:hypothetical protein
VKEMTGPEIERADHVRDPDRDRVRLRDGVAFSGAVFIAVRLLLSLVAVLTVRSTEPPSVTPPTVSVPATPGWHNALDGTNRWDAAWFEGVARYGYDWSTQSAAFMPAYPLVIRGLAAALPVDETDAGLIASNVAFFLALVVLFALTEYEYSREFARRTVLLLAFFPASFFYFAPYSESLFLLATSLTFWWARRGRWGGAAAAGFVAVATRSVGVFLIPALVWEARSQSGSRRDRALVASFAPLSALALYSLYWLVHAGDALRPLHAEAFWPRGLAIPLITLGNGLWLGIMGLGYPGGIPWTADFILTAALLVPLCMAWKMIPRPYLPYVVVTVLFVLSFTPVYRPLVSAPRYIMVLFPIFWSMAGVLPGRRLYVVLGCFLLGFVLMSASFMNWGLIT